MIVRVSNLTKVYGEETNRVCALNDVTIAIDSREFVTIMGSSGSGKSTLLHMMGGLDYPTSGTIIIDKTDITKLNENELALLRRRRLGFVFQSYNLVSVLTAEENIALPLLMDGVKNNEIENRVSNILELVGMTERKSHRPSQLSGGEQQRVAIARALINEPGIIFADEPTGNLDSVHAEEIMNLLQNMRTDSDCAIVMVTHDPKMAAYADRIVFLKDGKVHDQEYLGGKLDQTLFIEGLKGNTN